MVLFLFLMVVLSSGFESDFVGVMPMFSGSLVGFVLGFGFVGHMPSVMSVAWLLSAWQRFENVWGVCFMVPQTGVYLVVQVSMRSPVAGSCSMKRSMSLVQPVSISVGMMRRRCVCFIFK